MIVGLFTFSFPTREMNCRLGLISFFARGKVMISLSGAARSPAFRALRAVDRGINSYAGLARVLETLGATGMRCLLKIRSCTHLELNNWRVKIYL